MVIHEKHANVLQYKESKHFLIFKKHGPIFDIFDLISIFFVVHNQYYWRVDITVKSILQTWFDLQVMKWKPRHNITHHFSVALQFEMHLSWVRISKRLQSCVLLGPTPSIRPSNTFSQTISFCISDKILLCYTLLQHCMYHVTMLQKLSKCEVKAWLCWKLIITQILREIKFWWIQVVKECHFWTVRIHQKLISRKIRDAVEWLDFN